jgi:hypothetical protein
MPETSQNTAGPLTPKYPPNLKACGKRLWRELHRSADFSECPETRLVVEEACYLTDEIARQRRLIRAAGDDTRVTGSQKQPGLDARDRRSTAQSDPPPGLAEVAPVARRRRRRRQAESKSSWQIAASAR